MLANETSREELLMRDLKILFDENRRLKEIIKELEQQLKEKRPVLEHPQD